MHHCVRPTPPPGSSAVEDRFGGFPPVDGLGYGVGLLLVLVARPSHAVGKFGAVTLLYHVSRFMRGELHVRLLAESDAVANGIRQGSHASVGLRGGAANRNLRPAYVVAAERPLDAITVGKRLGRRHDTFAG